MGATYWTTFSTADARPGSASAAAGPISGTKLRRVTPLQTTRTVAPEAAWRHRDEARSKDGHVSEAVPRAVVLVEGISDRCALEALALRHGRNLAAERIAVVPIGGAQAIGRFLDRFGPHGLDLELAGLCDAAEEGEFRRGLARAGLGSHPTRADLERLGFYVCDADLEDELIRALGVAAVEQVVDAQGELGAFRTLQKQRAWNGRPQHEQLRRFMGSGGRRKIRYARLLVEALELDRVPRPLELVLARAASGR